MRALTVLVFLLAASPAAASTFAERPFEPIPRAGVATCLRATGVPGGLARFGAPSRTELMTAGTDGIERTATVALGRLATCATVAEAPGGAAVVAGITAAESPFSGGELRAVVRDPGGGFGAIARLGRAGLLDIPVAVAVSPAGHAIVAWAQRRRPDAPDMSPVRIVAVRRAPGGGFGRLERLTPWRRQTQFGGAHVVAGMDARGMATVAWTRPARADRPVLPDEFVVDTATAAPGAAFTRQRLQGRARGADHPALAVAPDGWALLAHDGVSTAFERPPGAPRFRRVLTTHLLGAMTPAVALREGGGALVAWRRGIDEARAGVQVVTRPGAGAFSTRQTLSPVRPRPSGEISAIAVAELGVRGAPLEPDTAALRAALAPDGRALLAWSTPRRSGGGVLTPRIAAGTLAGGFGAPQRLGSPVRDTSVVAPLFLGDGRAALAWTDNATIYGFPQRSGRVHLALEGAARPPEPVVPRLRVRGPRVWHGFASAPVPVRVSCDRACDVRAILRGRGGRVPVSRALAHAGAITLRLPRASRRAGRVRIVVHATAPGGHETTVAIAHVNVIPRPALPVPPPLGVRVRRDGADIVVTWHTEVPARRAYYVLFGSRRRHGRPDFSTFTTVEGRGRTRFRARLHATRPGGIRWIELLSISPDGGRAVPPLRVSVPPVRPLERDALEHVGDGLAGVDG